MRLDIPEHKILVHETALPILWGDMDSLGHVNNTIYFKYMEQARVTWIEAMTGSLTDAKEGPVIANAFFNFYQPLVFPGDLLIKLYVASPGRTSIDTSPPAGTIDARVGRSDADRKKMTVLPNNSSRGKTAITHYTVIERLFDAAVIECRLETGRTHQVRVHMASIGHPLLGDPVYGRTPSRLRPLLNQLHFHRQALHAAVLGFIHPVTGAAIRLESTLPTDMAGLLVELRTPS